MIICDVSIIFRVHYTSMLRGQPFFDCKATCLACILPFHCHSPAGMTGAAALPSCHRSQASAGKQRCRRHYFAPAQPAVFPLHSEACPCNTCAASTMQCGNSGRLRSKCSASKSGFIYMLHHSEEKGVFSRQGAGRDSLKASPGARELCGQLLQRAQPCWAARAGHDGPTTGRASHAHQPRIRF